MAMEQIHGHEVLQMMMTSGKAYTREGLLADINARFGPQARFYTCSADNLTADGLISFLEGKGKFIAEPEGFKTSPNLMCKH